MDKRAKEQKGKRAKRQKVFYNLSFKISLKCCVASWGHVYILFTIASLRKSDNLHYK